jgi:hypothetical protein
VRVIERLLAEEPTLGELLAEPEFQSGPTRQPAEAEDWFLVVHVDAEPTNLEIPRKRILYTAESCHEIGRDMAHAAPAL